MTQDDLFSRAARIIREGGLVAFPTETVYGLGANAFDPRAVARIFALKERPSFDPLIVHISDEAGLARVTVDDDPRVRRLADAFWPGPLTLILPKRASVPDIVTAGLGTVGVRMPAHPWALRLIRESGCPIAAPSANKFGRVSPTRATHVLRRLPGVDLVLDAGECPVGIESTIVRLTEKGCTILRPGAITAEMIDAVVPVVLAGGGSGSCQAPGMMKTHYSPSKPLYLLGTEPPGLDPARGGVLVIGPDAPTGYGAVLRLSTSYDLQDYAAGLYAALQEFEELDLDYLLAPAVKEVGLGIAIMDRLQKAAWRCQAELP